MSWLVLVARSMIWRHPCGGTPVAERMRILTPDGLAEVEVGDPDERSRVGDYWNAVQYRLDTGSDSELRRFDGVTVAGRPLETDGRTIDRWARQGEIDFEDIYGD